MKLRRNIGISILIWNSFLLICNVANAQHVLLLEIKNQIEAVKFYSGDQLIYKTKDQHEWQHRTIIRLIPESDVILFEDGMVTISEINKVQLKNEFSRGLGKLFTGFGATWLLFGGILDVADREPFTWTTLAIGATSLGVGQLLLRVVGKKNYTIGKYTRLRMIDITMPEQIPALQH